MLPSRRVGIYLDEGVSSSSFLALKDFCTQYMKTRPRKLSSEDILEQEIHDLDWIFFPGGRDIYYHEKLKGRGCEILKEWVCQGGFYIGICAGAYFGCEEIEFEKGEALELCDKRELAFFSGRAIGSAYLKGEFDYYSHSGSTIAKLRFSDQERYAESFFKGGCYFEANEKEKDSKVIGVYYDLPNNPVAILSKPVGKGKVLLSGVHPEFSKAYLEKKHPNLIDQLSENNLFGHELFLELLKKH